MVVKWSLGERGRAGGADQTGRTIVGRPDGLRLAKRDVTLPPGQSDVRVGCDHVTVCHPGRCRHRPGAAGSGSSGAASARGGNSVSRWLLRACRCCSLLRAALQDKRTTASRQSRYLSVDVSWSVKDAGMSGTSCRRSVWAGQYRQFGQPRPWRSQSFRQC